MNDKRLYHTIANKITRLIDSGVYPPGSRLPGERELAEKFDVSRVTIREAEIALQALGRIHIKTGSGVYVLDPAESANGGVPEVSAFELTEARLLFESEAAALAAKTIDDKTIAKLERCFQQMSSIDPSEEVAADAADREFHLTIASASGNKAVRHVVETLWKMRTDLDPVREVYDSVCHSQLDQRGDEHSDILEALRQRDPDAARQAMRKHFRRLLETMLDATEAQALKELRRQSTESRARFLQNATV